MSAPIFAIRPEPGLSATMAAARECGLDIFGEPLFELRPVPWALPDRSTVDALLIGSANAFRLGGVQLDRLRQKPVHAVGKMTAEIAAKHGFYVEKTGKGGLQSLLDAQISTKTAPLKYLRLCGAERVLLDVPPGVHVEERIVYQAAPLNVSAAFEKRLRSGGIVMLHSAAAARHFAAECARLSIPLGALSLAALGPRILASIGGDWANIREANHPDEMALLALVADMCQGR